MRTNITTILITLCSISSIQLRATMPTDSLTIVGDSLSVQLQELTVEAPKATIRREGMNYTISNLGGTFLADAGTLLDMLRWTPGLVVNDENDIKTGDNKSVGEIYIDERKVTDRNLLLTLPSNQVSKVEVIRDLSARYSGPTIKITLKKGVKDYLGLSVGSTTAFQRRVSESTWANVDAKYGKWALHGSLRYSFSNGKAYDFNRTTITNPDDGSLILDDARDGGFTYRSNTWFWNAGINYFATPKLTLIAQYSGSTRSGKLTHWGLHELLYLGMDSVVNELQHEPVSDRSNHNATAGLTYKPDAGRTFTFTVSYSHRSSDNMRTITLTPAEGNETFNTTYTQNSYNLWDGEANYSFPLLGSEIEVGTNLSWIGNKYSYAFSGSTQPSHRDDFTGAWYGSWKRTYGNWKPEVGLRLVYNDSRLKQGDNVDDKKEKRTSVRPHASLLYTISDNYQLKAQYSISGGFPSISQLNPAIVYESMLHYSKGNPDLKQYTWHYASLSANLKDFSVEASFGCTLHDIFTAILPYGSDYSIIDYPVNSRYINTWVLYADYSHTLGKVSVNASLSGCLFHTKFDRMEGYLNPPTSSQSMSAYAQARWQFCKSGEFYGSVRYTSPMQGDLTRSGRSLGINLGYTQRFLDNRLRVTVEGRDLLNQAITPRWSQNYGHVSQWQRNRYDTRGVTLRVQYVFNTLNNGYRNARINKQSDQRAN